MNLLANPLADAQKVWNNVKGAKEPRAAIGRTDKENDVAVFSFITPSIIGESRIVRYTAMACYVLTVPPCCITLQPSGSSMRSACLSYSPPSALGRPSFGI